MTERPKTAGVPKEEIKVTVGPLQEVASEKFAGAKFAKFERPPKQTETEIHTVKTADQIAEEEREALKKAEAQKHLDRILGKEWQKGEKEVVEYYTPEQCISVDIDGERLTVPFAYSDERDNYLNNPERVGQMTYQVMPGKYNPEKAGRSRGFGWLQKFFDIFIKVNKEATGKPSKDGPLMRVAGYDSEKNQVTLQETSYFYSAAFQNLGLDADVEYATSLNTGSSASTGEPAPVATTEVDTIAANIEGATLTRDPMTPRTYDAPDGDLPSYDDSCLPNTIGVGGILISSDGYLMFPSRDKKMGPTSLAGKLGLTASGAVKWPDKDKEAEKHRDLLMGAGGGSFHQTLGDEMKREVHEEVGLDAIFKSSIESFVADEVGIDVEKCTFTPLAFARDLMRGGKPQMFYVIRSTLSADQITQSMAGSKDGAKEYTGVLAIKSDKENI